MSKPQISFQHKFDRVIVLIDMDCFYCQVEERLDPELTGKPIAVVQYNAWRGGGIIAVNYPARAQGVTRHMRGDEAKAQCPDIALVKVPNVREKADLSKYREAGKEVAAVLQTFTPLLQRASIDEAYLDITEKVQSRLIEMNEGKFALQPDVLKNTYALGYTSIGDYIQDISRQIGKPAMANNELNDMPEEDRKAYRKSDIKLLIGSSIVNEIRAAVKAQTGYECSAGIAHNKILAKLVCGMNKPNKQTILPLKHITQLYENLAVRKVQGLGGKFGEKLCEDLGIENMGQLSKCSKEELQRRYDERYGLWLYNIARGIDLEAVTPRMASKSIGCCKKFPGRNAIVGLATLEHWFHELAKEICERLEQDELENNRRAKQMVVSYMQAINQNDVSSSRCVGLTAIDEDKIVKDAVDVLKRNTDKFLKLGSDGELIYPIKFLGLSVGKFESQDSKRSNTIQDMFKKTVETAQAKSDQTASAIEDTEAEDQVEEKQDAVAAKKDATIQDLFKKSAENAESKRVAAIDEPAVEENKENSAIQEEAKPSNTGQSFFAKWRMAKMNAPVVDPVQPSTSANVSSSSIAESIVDNDNSNSFQNDDSLQKSREREMELNFLREPSPEPCTSKAATADYKQTYAEFYCPSTADLDIPKEKCTQCGKMVNVHDVQVHADEHFAFQLTQEQRTEFQSQLQSLRGAVSTPPAAKKFKTSKTTTAITPRNATFSIDKFLVKKDAAPPPEESVAGCSSAMDVASESCTECGKTIPIADILEHMDYHAAKKLHEELMKAETTDNRPTLSSSKSKVNSVVTAKGGKNKKKTNNNNNDKSHNSSSKSIATFFQNS